MKPQSYIKLIHSAAADKQSVIELNVLPGEKRCGILFNPYGVVVCLPSNPGLRPAIHIEGLRATLVGETPTQNLNVMQTRFFYS